MSYGWLPKLALEVKPKLNVILIVWLGWFSAPPPAPSQRKDKCLGIFAEATSIPYCS